MLDDLHRYETNRKVRQVLISRNVDMTRVSYSCAKKTVYVYGSLYKLSQEEFGLADVKSMVGELMRLPHVHDIQFDLDNWFIVTEPGEVNIIKGRKPEMFRGKKYSR